MSGGVGAIGKSAAVATEIAKQFANGGKCVEPEEGIRQQAAILVGAAIAAQDPTTAIKVSASGSQSTIYKDGKAAGFQNNLNITVEPQYGFVE